MHPSVMGFTKGTIFNLVETVLFRQFETRHREPRHRRTYMLITDEADAFDGMDRQLAEIALHEMGLRGKWWILESNMTARQQVRVDVNGTLSEPYNRTGGLDAHKLQRGQIISTGKTGTLEHGRQSGGHVHHWGELRRRRSDPGGV